MTDPDVRGVVWAALGFDAAELFSQCPCYRAGLTRDVTPVCDDEGNLSRRSEGPGPTKTGQPTQPNVHGANARFDEEEAMSLQDENGNDGRTHAEIPVADIVAPVTALARRLFDPDGRAYWLLGVTPLVQDPNDPECSIVAGEAAPEIARRAIATIHGAIPDDFYARQTACDALGFDVHEVFGG